MIFGIGTDFLKISRLNPDFLQDDDPFFEKTFTAREISQGSSRPDRVQYFAGRFAGKEAVFKTMHVSGDRFKSFRDIEITDDETGAPQCRLYGEIRSYAEQSGVEKIHVSLSADDGYVLAVAIAERGD